MNAKELLTTLENDGIQISLNGENIRLKAPPGLLNESRIDHIRSMKPCLVKYLREHQIFKIWRLVVDGKGVTVIGQPCDRASAMESTYQRFGKSRVSLCEPYAGGNND